MKHYYFYWLIFKNKSFWLKHPKTILFSLFFSFAFYKIIKFDFNLVSQLSGMFSIENSILDTVLLLFGVMINFLVVVVIVVGCVFYFHTKLFSQIIDPKLFSDLYNHPTSTPLFTLMQGENMSMKKILALPILWDINLIERKISKKKDEREKIIIDNTNLKNKLKMELKIQ